MQLTVFFNTMRPRQRGQYFADIFTHFLKRNLIAAIDILLRFVPDVLIDNTSSLVRTVAWRRTGDKPLSKPIMAQVANAYTCMRRPASLS